MSLFNRALIIILLLVSIVFWLAVAAVVLLSPDELVSVLKYSVLFLEANITLYTQLMVALLAVIVVLASALILVIELTPSTPSAVQLTQVASGVAMLTTDAIGQRIKHDMQALPEVHEVVPKVAARGRSVDITLELRTGPDSNVTKTSEEAGRLVRDSVEKNMGVKIRRLLVNIHHEPYLASPQPTARVVPPSASSPQPEIYMPDQGPGDTTRAPDEKGE
ncbi:MAG: hypothetical protein HYX92_00435 [Chloroflexi bacterium]|nr:hypothetical protein [Chloroflexota bacterium]